MYQKEPRIPLINVLYTKAIIYATSLGFAIANFSAVSIASGSRLATNADNSPVL